MYIPAIIKTEYRGSLSGFVLHPKRVRHPLALQLHARELQLYGATLGYGRTTCRSTHGAKIVP